MCERNGGKAYQIRVAYTSEMYDATEAVDDGEVVVTTHVRLALLPFLLTLVITRYSRGNNSIRNLRNATRYIDIHTKSLSVNKEGLQL